MEELMKTSLISWSKNPSFKRTFIKAEVPFVKER
jgi:hypothetical protein